MFRQTAPSPRTENEYKRPDLVNAKVAPFQTDKTNKSTSTSWSGNLVSS